MDDEPLLYLSRRALRLAVMLAAVPVAILALCAALVWGGRRHQSAGQTAANQTAMIVPEKPPR